MELVTHRQAGTGLPSDLTDEQWERLEPLIPTAKSGGRPRKTNMRAAMNAILCRAAPKPASRKLGTFLQHLICNSLDGLTAAQDVFHDEVITMLDEPKVGQKIPHRHAGRGENSQSHCRGDLSRRRPGGVGSGIRRPPALVSMHQPPQFPSPGKLPQERGNAIGAARQASTIAGDITSLLVHWYGSRQRLHRTRDRANRPPSVECEGESVADSGMNFIRLAIGDDIVQGPAGPGSNRGELSATAPAFRCHGDEPVTKAGLGNVSAYELRCAPPAGPKRKTMRHELERFRRFVVKVMRRIASGDERMATDSRSKSIGRTRRSSFRCRTHQRSTNSAFGCSADDRAGAASDRGSRPRAGR